MQAYPHYKDSGLPWVGQIPGHWETRRISTLGKVGNGSTPSRDNLAYWSETGTPWLNSGAVHQGIIQTVPRHVTPLAIKECHLPLVSKGSIVIAITGQGKTRGSSAVLGIDATINQHLAYITVRDNVVDSLFLRFSLAASYRMLRAISDDVGGTKGALTCATIKRFSVVLPPLPEQTRIATYLRSQDAKIARFIRIKREFIEKLKEYQLRLIDHAVTGGLDTSGKRKPSGVAWLGEVPGHWDVLKLKFTTHKIVGGSTPKSDKPEYWDGGIVWITPRDISKTDSLHASQRTISAAGLQSCGTVIVPPESIIITSRAPVGNVAIARVELCTNQGCKAILPAKGIVISDYLFLLLRKMKDCLQSLANGTTFAEIGTWTLANEFIPVPPVEEQKTILAHIAAKTEPLTKAITQAETEITLIREYRERLILDAVTGQIDLRGWQGAADDALDDDSLADLADDDGQEIEEDISHENT